MPPPATCSIPARATAGPAMLARLAGNAPLAEIRDLAVRFVSREATVHAVNGVSFSVRPGEVLCILGESGSGKSVTLRAVAAAAAAGRPRGGPRGGGGGG